ncbi:MULTISPECIES: ATP-dependent helicase [Cupriavidus]|uniref:DNA 3'-5' helicase n=1 Tax=Cupriavidus metallidurans TaxID=119219 RepID=A0A482IUN2_9BURK|nr:MULTISPECIES: ATP-dependent helicase [Cupriavidus]KWR80192.1 ATP-dependent DNA helicase [Cupriavidus sp. SHE]QBP11582.1 ATP-dependent helicase [Cupriavidus metallidurans]QWC90165.1 ATP-dependent helicase [Cupriavidus metallidurans]
MLPELAPEAAAESPDTEVADAPVYLSRLNPEQRAAVEYDGDAPLLIIAGAGSGKTNTLAHRVAHLVVNGADPRRILLLTFSRRAASEMGRRVERIVDQALGIQTGAGRAALQWSGTFHAIGARLLREYAETLGLAPTFTISDRGDAADLMHVVRHDLGLSEQTSRFPRKETCLAIYSRVVNTQLPLEVVLKTQFPRYAMWADALKGLFAAYVEAKQKQQVLDYDDLLLYWAQAMTEPALAQDMGARFDHVLVDEYQDTNALQASILLALKPQGRGLTVVGDDAQSIYAFRGATVRNILDFPTQFSPPAEQVTLSQNYRSTQPILGAANAVIGLAAERFTKDLWSLRESAEKPGVVVVNDEAEQARFVVEQVLARREAGLSLMQQAVLFRAADHSAQVEIELARRNIPFVKFGGLKFLESTHVKDVMAVVRWLENPRDRMAGFRTLQLLPGVGPKTAARVLEGLEAATEPLIALEAFEPPPAAAPAWDELVTLARALMAPTSPWPSEFEQVIAWYMPHLERMHDDAAARQADLQQIEHIAATYASRERFLTELTLDPPSASSDESGVPSRDEDYLILSTIHSAKGQEWKAVYVLNAVDGCMPSDLATGTTEEIEEERRLLYVAMTRARDHLDIVVPQRFYVHNQVGFGDRHVYASRTRFLPNRVMPNFYSRSWPPAPMPGEGQAKATLPQVDLASRMRGMWK